MHLTGMTRGEVRCALLVGWKTTDRIRLSFSPVRFVGDRSSAQRSSNSAYQMRWAQPLRGPLLIFKHRANARGAAILSRIGAQS